MTGGGWGGFCMRRDRARDIVQNCFSYHMTPAGMIFENGARAVGATVFPAGTGQTELQVARRRISG
jgi:phenylacetate-CoA ligase